MYGAVASDVRLLGAEAERGVVSLHHSASALQVWHCHLFDYPLNPWADMKKTLLKGLFDAVLNDVSGHVDVHFCSKKELMARENSQFS